MARQERAEVTRSAILEGAARAFEKAGFAGTSLSDIVGEAGVTKGALYFHFASKEELAQAVVQEQFSVWDNAPEGENLSVQSVIDLLHNMAEQLQESTKVRAAIRLVVDASSSAGANADPYVKWIELIRSCLAQSQSRGDIKAGIDVEAVANLIVGSWTGLQLSAQVLTGRKDLNERTTLMWQMMLPGLVPPRRIARFHPEGTGRPALGADAAGQ
ncbi:ScbR family autoregulator-binding transcription factor [Streptomyces sp. NPDC020807]|uniref:ScbR family autoregulator-binding transcription factor n=1 Tax=Streptomyces sp. NPDC020807 TaxID=3155119 RepID=UPI0033C763DE